MAEIVGAIGAVGVVLLVVWGAVLAVFAPFFWYGTNKRTKETSLKLDEANRLLREINDAIRDQSRPSGL